MFINSRYNDDTKQNLTDFNTEVFEFNFTIKYFKVIFFTTTHSRAIKTTRANFANMKHAFVTFLVVVQHSHTVIFKIQK